MTKTKEEAFSCAEKLLLRIYNGDIACCAVAATAVADRDAETLIKMLEASIELEIEIIDTLKQE